MDRTYLITGANGHLGRHIVRQLLAEGQQVRAFLLRGETMPLGQGNENLTQFWGDICDMGSLEPLFAGLEGREVVVIHTAAVIDITSKVTPKAYEVNVCGTKNMVALALRHRVYRFIYVSSVHAIAEPRQNRLIQETRRFSAGAVEGGYAKTKAEAAAFVLEATEKNGLPAVLLHPSGILGPMDGGNNNLVEAVKNYVSGKLRVCPKGGYDFVDVRDVAAACITAVDKGRVGEPYILSGRYYRITEVFDMLSQITGKKRGYMMLPNWVAEAAAPAMEKAALKKGKAPLVTKYSLYTLRSNAAFSHKKASRELDFWPRDIWETLADTVRWLAQKAPSRKRTHMVKAGAKN